MHRWITCEAWSTNELVRQGHSWFTLGDMAMLDRPMVLHAVDIGRMSHGRRMSPWAKAWKDPVIAHHFRFQVVDKQYSFGKRKGKFISPKGEHWRSIWYADLAEIDAEKWVAQMDSDQITPSLLHATSIARLSPARRDQIRAEISQAGREICRVLPGLTDRSRETVELGEAGIRDHSPHSALLLPPTRSACDPPFGPCPFQYVCYSDDPEGALEDTGLYRKREVGAAERSSSPLLQIAPRASDGLVTVDVGA